MVEVRNERRAGVAIVTLDRPVANVLAPSLRSELSDALAAAMRDDSVEAIVLTSAGADLSSGVDMAEYDTPLQSPWISDLCLQIENAPKPVVAALQGAAFGGGFELALAAHGRIAAEDARVALPEVKLGLSPGGGATQRLPRMAGAQAALEVMLSGQVLNVADPRLKPVIDKVVPGPPLEAAVTYAQELAQSGDWSRARDISTGFADPLAFQSEIEEMKGKLRSDASVAADIVRCVEAAQLLPYERGLELERVIFEERCASPESRARRHLSAAGRRARVLPERSTGHAVDVAEVVVPGSSALVSEIVIACLDAGLQVTLLAEDGAGTEAVRGNVGDIYDGAVARGVLTAEASDTLMSRLLVAGAAEALGRADMVLDTGEIDLRAHSAMLNPALVWVSVSAGGPMPKNVPPNVDGRHVDIRVYRPVVRAALIELSVSRGATADAVVSVAQMFNRTGRTVIRCEPVDGLVGGNMSATLFGAALTLAAAGASPYRIDAAARALGFARGPFQLLDLEGLPNVATRLGTLVARGVAVDPVLLNDRIASGAVGRVAGRGFYLYEAGGIKPDISLPSMTGATQNWTSEQLAAALLAALVNEAARLVSVPVVQRMSDIDLVMVSGFGFDKARGGPLFLADLKGLFNVMRDMQKLAPLSEALWQPHPMIGERVKNGEGILGGTH